MYTFQSALEYLAKRNPYFMKQCGITTKSTVEEVKNNLQWGTYGRPTKVCCFKWVKLIDCSSEHLRNIRKVPAIYPLIKIITDVILSERALKGNTKVDYTKNPEKLLGTRWTRPDYDPTKGVYNGYTVRFVTNLGYRSIKHPSQVVYQGDNGLMWSLPLEKWPGNLVLEDSLNTHNRG
jgi:hypothetical protein